MREVHKQEDHLDDETHNAVIDESGQFLGRAVWFHCKICGRVQVQGRMVKPGEVWEEASVALRMQDLDPQDVWWFQTLCGCCQPTISPRMRSNDIQMPVVSYATRDETDKSEHIVVYKTHLVRLLSYRLGKGAWVPTAWILPSIGARDHRHLVCEDSISPLPTRDEANALAKKLATEWIDSLYSSVQ